MSWVHTGDTITACQKSSPLDALETRMLLCHALGLTRIQLITQSENKITSSQAARISSLFAERTTGVPIAYLLQQREFYGLSFYVTPAVLIPRPETELLVELALAHTPTHGRLLDLGTGSGAIAIAVAAQQPQMQVTATDISQDALAVAKKNAGTLLSPNASMTFIQSDWYQSIPIATMDTIVSNPPYIVKDDAHLTQGDLRFEPIHALTDNADGLSAYRHIIAGASAYLKPQGWLLMEHGYDQSNAVQELLHQYTFIDVQSWPDLAGILRVTGGKFGG